MRRLALGLALLLVQVAWLVTGSRPTLWAPFHEHAVYSLAVTADGRTLDTKASLERYRLPTWHVTPARDEAWETNDLQRVKDVIVAFEARSPGPVAVELRSRINGEEQPAWRWSR